MLNLNAIVGFTPSEYGSHTLLAIVNDPVHKPCREKFDDIKAAVQANAASFIVPRSRETNG
jgi:hypothetical protein